MSTQGYFIVFGPLLVIVGLIVGGSMTPNPWGGGMLAAGILAGIAWFLFALHILNSMNTDI